MNALSYIRMEIEWAHQLLALTMADVTPEMAQAIPPGIANPLGSIFAHALLAEDGVINGLLKQGAPLFASTWADKTGVANPQMQLSIFDAHSQTFDEIRRLLEDIDINRLTPVEALLKLQEIKGKVK